MSEWGILDILDVIRSCPQHRFLVLTKNPSRLFDFKIPSNCGVGVSIDGKYQTTGLDELARCEAGMKFVSFEPLLAPVNPSVLYTYLRSLFPIMYNPVDWVIIGGQSRTPTCKKFVPPYWWVMPIIEKARKIGVPVFLKNNLEWDEPVREYPDFLRIGD
jgi:protein gp37